MQKNKKKAKQAKILPRNITAYTCVQSFAAFFLLKKKIVAKMYQELLVYLNFKTSNLND